MSDQSNDEQLMRRALDLTRQGVGLSSPNPHVGAVIADAHGKIVGTGVYTYDGKKHAEIRALEHAGESARGGTLYINLEPHSHQGRTPPCTDALIAAGLRRVVASMPDPNPKVSGSGFEKLRVAGIQVEVGAMETEARRINEAFARYILHGIPLVTLKSAMTLDGKIAPPPGFSSQSSAGVPAGGWITGDAARAHVHQQRHQSDALLVGIGTVLADDPLLTDRSRLPRRRPLLRVILDSRLRLPLNSRLLKSVENRDGRTDDILVICSFPDENKKRELQARGIHIEQVAANAGGRPDIHAVLQLLGRREITSVIIEGGSAIYGMTLASGIVDKLFLYYAPTIMAAEGAIPFAYGPHSSANKKLEQIELHRFGEDFAVEGYLHDPYQS